MSREVRAWRSVAGNDETPVTPWRTAMANNTLTISANRTGTSYEIAVADGAVPGRAVPGPPRDPADGGVARQWQAMLGDPEQKIARPRQIYTGPARRDYIPSGRRA
jgi:hypothetical protein